MIKFNTHLIVFLFIVINSIAQNTYSDTIKLQANLFVQATKENDFKTIVNYTNPKLVELLGGKDSLYVKISNSMVLLQQEGLRYKSIELDIFKIIKTNKNLWYAVIPQKIIQINSQGQIITETFLFATSINQGENWFFMDEERFRKYKDTLFEKVQIELECPEKNQCFIKNKGFTSLNKPN